MNYKIAEILSKKNFDTITLDFEHGSFDLHRLNDIFRAIECENKVSLVRLPNHKTEILGQIFDSGCDGVIIPNVTNPFHVENIAKNCNWPPSGKRGGIARANTYVNILMTIN